MKSYTDMKLAEAKKIDSDSRKYLESLLAEHSRTFVEQKIRVKSYTTFRNQHEKAVNMRCNQLLAEGFDA